jgi:uncharacterized protein YjdB
MKKKLFAPLFFLVCALVLSSSDCTGIGPNYVPVTGISVTPESITLPPGGSFQLQITVTPHNATRPGGTWHISDHSKVAVTFLENFKCLVAVFPTATAGTATILLITDDGGHTASCIVTVDPAVPAVAAAQPLTDPVIPEGVNNRFGDLK